MTYRQLITLAVLQFAFGVGAIVGNLAVVIGAITFALLPLSSAYFATALVAAIVISGVCGYAVVVPQQHRLIALSPASTQLVVAPDTNTDTNSGSTGRYSTERR
jgi:hypothetical protein